MLWLVGSVFYFNMESECEIMIPVSQEEVKYLTSHGVQFGEHGISSTKTRYKKYFVTETERNMRLLEKFRKQTQYAK